MARWTPFFRRCWRSLVTSRGRGVSRIHRSRCGTCTESNYYLHHFTRDPQYRKMGEKIFDDFAKYCRVDAGYAALEDVVTKEKRDEMESFVLAETFKYFYLLFAPPDTLDFDKVVFNTEAHPLRRTW